MDANLCRLYAPDVTSGEATDDIQKSAKKIGTATELRLLFENLDRATPSSIYLHRPSVWNYNLTL